MSEKRNRFRGKVSHNAKKQATGAQYGYLRLPKGVNVYQIEGGGRDQPRVKFDILPYRVEDENHPDRDKDLEIATVGELWYRRPFFLHRSIGAAKDSLVCPTSVGKKCPICEYRRKRQQAGAEKEEIDAMKASQRNLYALVPIEDKKHEEKIHIWDISQFLFQKLLNEEIEENENYESFPDPEEGYTLRVRFEAKTFGGSNPFFEANRIDFEERNYVYDDEFLATVPCLDHILEVKSYEELERIFLEIEDPDEESEKGSETAGADDPDQETTSPRRPKPKSADPAPADEEEEDEKPRDRRPLRRAPPAPDAGADEEEAPPRQARQAAGPTRQRETKPAAGHCPSGYKFGVDTDKYDECAQCSEWETCIDAKEAVK